MTTNSSSTNDPEANRYAAEPPRFSRTLIADFGWMIPDLPDHAWRVYCCVRAFIFDKDPEAVSVQLTDEEIARLIGRSESAVKRGRRECYKHGLLYEHDRNTKHYYPENASHWVRTVRTLGVTLDPPNEWSGPTNCYARLREIRAEIQTERTPKPEGSQVTTQADQVGSEGSSVSPGQPEGSKVTDFGSKVTDFGSKVTDFGSKVTDPPGGAQRGTRLHLSPHLSFHLSNQPRISPTGDDDDGSGAIEKTAGWMDVENGHQTPTTQPSAGEELLAHVERRNAATLTAQRGEHVRTVDAALDVLPRDQVQAVLGDGLDRASSPSGALVARVRSLPEQARQYREQREEQRRRHEQRERALNDREDRKRAERDAAKPAAAASDEVQQAAMDQMRQLLANQKGTTQVRASRRRSAVPRARGTAS